MGHLFCVILLAHLALTFAFLKSRVSRKQCLLKVSASERNSQNEKIDFDAAIRQCRYSKDFTPAIKLAEKALLLRPMPSSLLTGVIKVFGEANQLGRAVSLLRVMKEEMSIAPNEYHLSALIVACRRCGQWEMAVALYNRTDSLGIKKNTVICNGIISVLGDALQWETVFSILNEMDTAGIKKDIVTYSAAITAFSKAGEWQHAIKMYRLMSISGITPNTITFNSVLSACARGRQVKMALDLFSEASSRGIVLDTISYSVVIKVCGEMNEFNLALKIFNAMEEKRSDSSPATVANSAVISNVLPLTISITTPITLVDQQKDYLPLITSGWNSSSSSQFSTDYIKGLISSCIVVRRDTGCFNAMITSCERAGDWKTALSLINQMSGVRELGSKVGYRPKVRPDCKTYSAAISCLGKAGQWEQAEALFCRMDKEGIKKDTAVYNAMIAALQLEGQKRLKEEAAAMTAEMRQPLITSTMLFERVQRLYSEGLEDGQLQHWAYDEDGISGKGNRDWHEETRKKTFEGLDPPVQKKIYIDNRPSDGRSDGIISVIQNGAGSTDASLIDTDPIVSIIDMDRDMTAVNVTLSRSSEGLSTSRLIDTPEIDQDKRLQNTDSSEKIVKSDQFLNTSNTDVSNTQENTNLAEEVCPSDISDLMKVRSPLIENPVAASESDFFSTGSIETSETILASRRKLDLHGFPLAVAKAAIDYEFKKIYDDHCEHLLVTEQIAKSVFAGTVREDNNFNGESISDSAIKNSISTGGNNGHSASASRDMRSSRRNRMKNSNSRTDNQVRLTEPVAAKERKRPNMVAGPLNIEPERLESSYDLYIVTGRGRHINNSGTRGVLRNELRDYILYTYNIKSFSIDGNDGCVKVTRASLIDWFREMDGPING